MQGCRGVDSSYGAKLSAGCIEGLHGRVRNGTTPEGVKASAIFIFAQAGGPVSFAIESGLPKVCWLRWVDRGAIDFRAE